MSGEVPLKKGFVDRDVLEPHDALSWLVLENAIHEQKRIAMGQRLDDVVSSVHPRLLCRTFEHLTNERHRSAVARSIRDESSAHPLSCEREIANEVHCLVTHELIIPPKLGVDETLVIEHDGIRRRDALYQSLRPQRVGLAKEAECSRC